MRSWPIRCLRARPLRRFDCAHRAAARPRASLRWQSRPTRPRHADAHRGRAAQRRCDSRAALHRRAARAQGTEPLGLAFVVEGGATDPARRRRVAPDHATTIGGDEGSRRPQYGESWHRVADWRCRATRHYSVSVGVSAVNQARPPRRQQPSRTVLALPDTRPAIRNVRIPCGRVRRSSATACPLACDKRHSAGRIAR